MRVLVCGGRRFSNLPHLEMTLERFHARIGISCLIHGDAGRDEHEGRAMVGADKLAGRWAHRKGIDVIAEAADWDKYGVMAGRIRNNLMLKTHHPEIVIAFHGSHGTAHMRSAARKKGLRVVDASLGLVPVYREIEVILKALKEAA